MAWPAVWAYMPARRRNENRDEQSGQYATNYTDEVFLDTLERLGETGAREVSNEIGCDYDTARRRLLRLVGGGDVKRRQLSGLTLWSLADETDNSDTPAEGASV